MDFFCYLKYQISCGINDWDKDSFVFPMLPGSSRKFEVLLLPEDPWVLRARPPARLLRLLRLTIIQSANIFNEQKWKVIFLWWCCSWYLRWFDSQMNVGCQGHWIINYNAQFFIKDFTLIDVYFNFLLARKHLLVINLKLVKNWFQKNFCQNENFFQIFFRNRLQRSWLIRSD